MYGAEEGRTTQRTTQKPAPGADSFLSVVEINMQNSKKSTLLVFALRFLADLIFPLHREEGRGTLWSRELFGEVRHAGAISIGLSSVWRVPHLPTDSRAESFPPKCEYFFLSSVQTAITTQQTPNPQANHTERRDGNRHFRERHGTRMTERWQLMVRSKPSLHPRFRLGLRLTSSVKVCAPR